jgi:hypothetical protein
MLIILTNKCIILDIEILSVQKVSVTGQTAADPVTSANDGHTWPKLVAFYFLINETDFIALLNIHLQSQLRVFIDVFFTISLTICFSPFGPSSGESQYIIFSHTSPENYRYLNGSVVSNFTNGECTFY